MVESDERPGATKRILFSRAGRLFFLCGSYRTPRPPFPRERILVQSYGKEKGEGAREPSRQEKCIFYKLLTYSILIFLLLLLKIAELKSVKKSVLSYAHKHKKRVLAHFQIVGMGKTEH